MAEDHTNSILCILKLSNRILVVRLMTILGFYSEASVYKTGNFLIGSWYHQFSTPTVVTLLLE